MSTMTMRKSFVQNVELITTAPVLNNVINVTLTQGGLCIDIRE